MFLIVEDMLKKTKLLCNISDTILVEEALTFLEENKVTIRPEKDEFSESVAEFMQRNRLKIDLQFSRSVIGSKMMTPCTEFLSAELATPECDPCTGEAWRGYSVFTSGYQSVDRLSDIDEFEESFKVMSVEDKTRHYYTLFRDLSPGASTPNSPTVSPLSSVPASPNRDSPDVKSLSPSKHSQDTKETIRPVDISTDLRSQAPDDPTSLAQRNSQQEASEDAVSPSTTSPGVSASTSPIGSPVTSPEHVSISIDSKLEDESMPEDSLLEDDELSEEGVEDKEKTQEEEEEYDDEDDEASTPHIESETSKTQSPSSDKDAPTRSNLEEEEKIRIIIEEENLEEEKEEGDELEVKSGPTTNPASNLPPSDSPRRDQVFLLAP